jgi:hypothetical protein
MALLQSADRADLLIGGRRLPAQSGRYFETLDPANEQVITHVAEADAADIDAAVAAARAAFEGEWGHMRAAPPNPPTAPGVGRRFTRYTECLPTFHAAPGLQ